MAIENECTFEKGSLVIAKNNPGQPGRVTGRTSRAGSNLMVEVRYRDGSIVYCPEFTLQILSENEMTISERFLAGRFGNPRDLQRTITYEKLKGTLHEVVYSMEAAQIDFYPYQFKPVLKIINSPTERLILADEVGLGKTIESALVWLELQARRQAKRLLVVCPRSLTEKWRNELLWKFQIDARIVDFGGFKQEIEELKRLGKYHAFSLIATYTGLRPPRNEIRMLKEHLDKDGGGSDKTQLLRELRYNPGESLPFDLVIFDEAHYMRNPETTTFHLGAALCACAAAVLCVSATPVHNNNTDLHSLLRLVDEDFFETQGLFEDLLEANRSTVMAISALSQVPLDRQALMKSLEDMAKSQFINNTPLYHQFVQTCGNLDKDDKTVLVKCQGMAEQLNLLGNYINRTRRIQVKENCPTRVPYALAVEYTPEEMAVYKSILQYVRKRCCQDKSVLHVFQVMTLQLRAASCLPVLAAEMRRGQTGDLTELVNESFGELDIDELFNDSNHRELPFADLLSEYDFEANDTKYSALLDMLTQRVTDEKVIVFAYYRPTLAYLKRRLVSDGLNIVDIHGGVLPEERWLRLDRFKDPNGPRVLLSSEVGSEGIDLQFCRVLVNYDLPWNPMRVEQRIGRIDRVGQQADKLSIINFKVKDTIEERLYNRLHEKLIAIRTSLGDIEDIIGKEMRQLTVDLLSNNLSPEQEEDRIRRTEIAIQNKASSIQQLEETGSTLVAFSDYLQRQVDETREEGRFMQPEELEEYVRDFFRRKFRGSELCENTPREGCMFIVMTPDARASLCDYIGKDTSPAALPFTEKEFAITFRRDIIQRLTHAQKRPIHFTNHLSPLIRWITKMNTEDSHAFYNVSSLKIVEPLLPPGNYSYLVERWKIVGGNKYERLAYAVLGFEPHLTQVACNAEKIVQTLLHCGRDWSYHCIDQKTLRCAYEKMEEILTVQFGDAVQIFEAENKTKLQIKEKRSRAFFDRRIAHDEQRLNTLRENNPESPVIKATEGRLKNARETKERKIDELREKERVIPERACIAAGIFSVEPHVRIDEVNC